MLRNPDEAALITYLEETYAIAIEAIEPSEKYEIVPSRGLRKHYLGKTYGFNLLTLEVSLGDWGVACWKDEHLSDLIQPPLLRAPEVILEAPWSSSVDIWNLGALLPELMFGQNMFSGRDSGEYTIKGHLAEMNALLGTFPESLTTTAGLNGAKDMFDSHGNVRKYRLKRIATLKQRFANLPDDEPAKFEAFTRLLLDLDPQKRRSADELLNVAWISHEYTQSVSAEKVN